MTAPATTASTALTAAMRNEGPFVLEWIAYHRVIGFEDIIIVTNDCTDGSDRLLSALAARGIITHFDQTVPQGTAPQDSAMRLTFARLAQTGTDWLCHLDSDEFLNIAQGAGHLSDLLAVTGHADVVALPWLFFGTSGHTERTLPVLPSFTASADGLDPTTTKFKSLFRWHKFGHAIDHRPVEPNCEDILVVSTTGDKLRNTMHSKTQRSKFHPLEKALAPGGAVVNHYATRAEDDFLMKNHRGDGQGNLSEKYHIGSKWFRIGNQNTVQNTSILRHWPATQALLQTWRSDPEIARLEAACLAKDAALRETVLTPQNRARWRARS